MLPTVCGCSRVAALFSALHVFDLAPRLQGGLCLSHSDSLMGRLCLDYLRHDRLENNRQTIMTKEIKAKFEPSTDQSETSTKAAAAGYSRYSGVDAELNPGANGVDSLKIK